jgi:hypothetical protein
MRGIENINNLNQLCAGSGQMAAMAPARLMVRRAVAAKARPLQRRVNFH